MTNSPRGDFTAILTDSAQQTADTVHILATGDVATAAAAIRNPQADVEEVDGWGLGFADEDADAWLRQFDGQLELNGWVRTSEISMGNFCSVTPRS